MKTTYRWSTSALCALTVITTMLVASESVKAQGVVITCYNGISPIVLDQTAVNSIVNAMITGNPSAGDWTYVPNGSTVNLSQVLSYSGNGNCLDYGVAITSTTPFTLSQIIWGESGTFGSTSVTLGAQGLTYDLFGVGINYGPDGIAGTADDITYTTGNASTPVNAVYLTGMVDTFDTGGHSSAATLQTLSAISPIMETSTYSLNGMSASSFETYVVPVTTPPVVNHPVTSDGNLILTGSGGTAGAGYTLLASTNVATPMASWTTNTTGNFDGSGDFSNAIPVNVSQPM